MTEPKKFAVSHRGRRDKGHDGERELARLLTEALGQPLERNVDQARTGGADLLVAGLYAVQVKRQQALALGAWWQQAVADATRHGLRPALAYRRNRESWQVVIYLRDLMPAIETDETATVTLAGFALVVKAVAA